MKKLFTLTLVFSTLTLLSGCLKESQKEKSKKPKKVAQTELQRSKELVENELA